MRKLLLIWLFLLLAPLSRAQQTLVSATITDPTGQPYAFGSGRGSIVCPGNAAPTINGSTVPRTIVISQLDGTGSFTQKFYDTNLLDQSGCGTQFAITDQTTIYSFTTPTLFTVTGNSANLSSQISSYSVPLPSTTSCTGCARVSANNDFSGLNTFIQTIVGSITGNAATATTATSAATAGTATNVSGGGTVVENFTGVYTNTQLNQPNQLNSGGFVPSGIYTQLGFGLTDALSLFNLIPSTATVLQGNAVGGYVQSNSTTTNGVALYGYAFAGTATSVFGQNTITTDQDTSGVVHNGTALYGVETDIGVEGVPNLVYGNTVALVGTGTVPASARAYNITRPTGTLQWPTGYGVTRGSVATVGLLLDGESTSNNTPSTAIKFIGYSSGGTAFSAEIQGDVAGNIVMNPSAAQNVNVGASNGMSWAEGTSSATVAGTDTCYGDSTAHALKCNYNGTAFYPETQTIGSGTTGTITGTALSATCDSGTVTGLTGATSGMPVIVSTTDGTDLGGAFYLRASVTSSGVVTVYVCGTGTPPSKAYNVRVIQ